MPRILNDVSSILNSLGKIAWQMMVSGLTRRLSYMRQLTCCALTCRIGAPDALIQTTCQPCTNVVRAGRMSARRTKEVTYGAFSLSACGMVRLMNSKLHRRRSSSPTTALCARHSATRARRGRRPSRQSLRHIFWRVSRRCAGRWSCPA